MKTKGKLKILLWTSEVLNRKRWQNKGGGGSPLLSHQHQDPQFLLLDCMDSLRALWVTEEVGGRVV